MKSMKKGLGKGLGALIPEDDLFGIDQQNLEVVDISLSEIFPNADQPRSQFDEESLQSLAESIKIHGVVQPILVRKEKNGYMIIAGERRWRAAKIAKQEKIPAIIKQIEGINLAQISLIENIQREDLSDIEEARAYQLLIDQFNLKQDEIADAVGKSRSHVTNTLRLLKLDRKIQDMILDGKLSGGHGRALLRVDSFEEQTRLAAIVEKEQLSVRQLEVLTSKKPVKKEIKEKTATEDHNLMNFENQLKDIYGTKVQIVHSQDKGKISIEFYGSDEFERIFNLLKK